MGEVFRARDTKLNRDVALKVLPDLFASDSDRLARFTREAQTLASLNHPNIAHIHGLEESTGARALVMELVEGDDLSQRLARGAMPLDEALPIAKQIAEALEAAHELGIIHRDLKPANIKVRADGTVKVLDFGLAKALEPAGAAPTSVSMSPTITTPAMTQAGMILGTAAYMSPEQARGRTVDRRADIWAFGAVLFEMLTGARAFGGEDLAETIGAVIHKEPEWSRLPAATPTSVRTVVRRCLQKDPKQRLRDIGDVRLALDGAFETDAPPMLTPATSSRPRGRLTWMFATALLALATPMAWYMKPRPELPLLTMEIAPSPGTSFDNNDHQFVLSPDGGRAVFIASGREQRRSLWLRTLDSGVLAELPDTGDPGTPFWSPDSRQVGFFADGMLKTIEIAGGKPRVLCEAPQEMGSWSPQGVILFSAAGKLQRVSAAGGRPVTALPYDEARQEIFQGAPHFLPNGTHFLYDTRTTGAERGIAWASLDGRDRKFLIQNRNSPGSYAPNPDGGPGWILYNSGGQLFAQSFDPGKGNLIDQPVLIADSVQNGPNWSHSLTGLISFAHAPDVRNQFVWFSRDGASLGVAGESGRLGSPRISPDQRTVAFARRDGTNSDILIFDPSRGGPTRLTFETGLDDAPVWTPDGSRVIYYSIRSNVRYLVERPVNGIGAEIVLKHYPNLDTRTPTAVTRDGRWVSLIVGGGGDSHTILMSRPEGKELSFSEPRATGAISPDGRWMLYTTDSSGSSEVRVQSVPPELGGPPNPARFQISTAGGRAVRWRADGQELFYIDAKDDLIAVAFDSNAGPRNSKALFNVGGATGFDVAADGRRFLLNQPLADAGDTPITVIVNWTQLLKK